MIMSTNFHFWNLLRKIQLLDLKQSGKVQVLLKDSWVGVSLEILALSAGAASPASTFLPLAELTASAKITM